MIGGRIFGDRTTLIRGGYVLTLDQSLGDMPNADVLIDGASVSSPDVRRMQLARSGWTEGEPFIPRRAGDAGRRAATLG